MRIIALAMVCQCAPSPEATVVEIPAPLPTPIATATASAGPETAPLLGPDDAECGSPAPATLDGCRIIGRLHVSDLRLSSSTCYVDAKVASGDVGVAYACPGGGVLTINGTQFRGAVSGTRFDVCIGTTFPWNDGCTWRSVQRIRGDVATRLEYRYAETAVSGTGCAPSSCTATARIEPLQ